MHGHHALLIVGLFEEIRDYVPEVFLAIGPDTLHIKIEHLKIDDVRSLKEQAQTRPFSSANRCFCISTSSIHTEAQHALLKLFEDPPETARFLLVIKNEENIIPTLRSRLHKIDTKSLLSKSTSILEDFLSLTYRERIESIQKKVKEKDTMWMETCIREIERFAFAHPKDEVLLGAVVDTFRFFNIRGASKKMLLEHLALSLPQRK